MPKRRDLEPKITLTERSVRGRRRDTPHEDIEIEIEELQKILQAIEE